MAEGNIYIKKFYENYPGVRDYFDKVISDCEKNGYVETLFGRKRYIKGINDRNKMIKSGAQREAIIIQEHTQLKLLIIEIHCFFDKVIAPIFES